MPKMKSNRAAMKRFKLTGRKKVRRHRAYANHKLTKKTTKRKRRLRDGTLASTADAARIKRMMLAE